MRRKRHSSRTFSPRVSLWLLVKKSDSPTTLSRSTLRFPQTLLANPPLSPPPLPLPPLLPFLLLLLLDLLPRSLLLPATHSLVHLPAVVVASPPKAPKYLLSSNPSPPPPPSTLPRAILPFTSRKTFTLTTTILLTVPRILLPILDLMIAILPSTPHANSHPPRPPHPPHPLRSPCLPSSVLDLDPKTNSSHC